jgi:hypothetical protein
VDLRLLQLDHRAAGLSELGELGVQRVAHRHDGFADVAIVQVAHRHRDELGRDGAELDRAGRQPLRRLPDRGVLQRTAADRPDKVGHDASLEDVVQDVARLVRNAGKAALHGVGAGARKAFHADRRIREPVVSSDVGIEAAVAVRDDVQTRGFLVAQIHRNGVQVLLPIAALDHRVAEAAPAEVFRIPPGPRQRADDRGRQNDARGRFVHCPSCRRMLPQGLPGRHSAATMKNQRRFRSTRRPRVAF